MSEHYFGGGRGKASSEVRERIDAAVGPLGVTFTNPTLPGEGPRYWFSCDNRGEPFNREKEDRTWDALQGAGLLNRYGCLCLE